MTARQQLAVPVAAWTRLPGTGYEVVPHGKRSGDESQVVVITCGSGRAELGGWDLSPVHRRAYIRAAR